MKRKLFLLLCALLTMIGVQAQSWTAPVTGSDPVNNGQYYLVNVEVGQSLVGANSWGTQASLTTGDNNGILAKLIQATETIGGKSVTGWKIQNTSGSKYTFRDNNTHGFVDMGNQNRGYVYKFTKRGDFYYIQTADNDPNYTASASQYVGCSEAGKPLEFNRNISDRGIEWIFVEKDNLAAVKSTIAGEKFAARWALYKALLKATEEGADTESAGAVYNNSEATKSQLETALSELNNVRYQHALSVASDSDPRDITEWVLTNPNFSAGNISGWDTNYKSGEQATNIGYQGSSYMNGSIFVDKFLEAWRSGNVGIGDGYLRQTVANLPEGKYLLEADAIAVNQGNASAQTTGALLFITADNADFTTSLSTGNGVPQHFSTEFLFTGEGDVVFGLKTSSTTANWIAADNFKVKFYGIDLSAYVAQLAKAVDDYEDLEGSVPSATYANKKASVVDVYNRAWSSSKEYSTAIAAIQAATNELAALKPDYVIFATLKGKAQAIADVEYEETTTGSHSTFTGVISAQTSAADNATTVATITTATSTLKAAIETYIKGAEPKNDGEYFDITCLMANPDFDDNTITGWTKESSMNPNTRIQCNEFYGSAAFDFYQVVNGLPNGSYTLGMKAFQRPGGYNDVYAAWKEGINNATAKVYVNSDESDVKNIMAEMNATRIYTDPAGEGAFNSDKMPTGADGYIPNSMEGAAAWFAADKYKTEVAALVEDGSLKLGFKDAAHSGDVWTLFDEFRLHYYGSSKLVYYKQYLPQLKAEVSADLTNNLYKNVLVSSEDEALDAALAAMPASETEEAYKTVIDNIKAAQTAFRAAAPSYDAMVAAKASSITKISGNIGTGVFQYDETTNNSLFSAYETAKSPVDSYEFTTSSTAAGAQTLVDALNTAINNYQNQALNAPDAEKRYWLSIVDNGQTWDGYAVTFIAGGRSDMGNYAIKYLAPASVNMDQAVKFVAVPGEANTYKLSGVRAENGGEQYISTGAIYEGSNTQIRTTDDVEKALLIKIQATTTEGQFKLLNTADGNKVIARNASEPDNGMYTDGNNNFTIAEASKAEVKLQVSNDKLGTFVAPFDITLPEKVKAYSATATETEVTLTKIAEGGDELKAGTPVVVYGDGADVEETFNKYAIFSKTENPTVDDNALVGLLVDKNVPAGAYVLQTQAGNQGFYKVAGTEAVPGVFYRSYLIAASPKARLVIIFDGEDPTAINAIEAAEAEDGALKDGKYLIDGKVILVKNGVKYSANGQILK